MKMGQNKDEESWKDVPKYVLVIACGSDKLLAPDAFWFARIDYYFFILLHGNQTKISY